MHVFVLLSLLNELGKRDKMRGFPSFLSLFRNEFNKCNKTGARMLNGFKRMTLKYFEIAFLASKKLCVCYMYATSLWKSFYRH